MDTGQPRDERLWKIARKRTNFKRSIYTYLIINAFFWAIWYFTNGKEYSWNGIPWPLWVTLGWGVGIAFQYFDAYGPNNHHSVEKEYDKLKKERDSKN